MKGYTCRVSIRCFPWCILKTISISMYFYYKCPILNLDCTTMVGTLSCFTDLTPDARPSLNSVVVPERSFQLDTVRLTLTAYEGVPCIIINDSLLVIKLLHIIATITPIRSQRFCVHTPCVRTGVRNSS